MATKNKIEITQESLMAKKAELKYIQKEIQTTENAIVVGKQNNEGFFKNAQNYMDSCWNLMGLTGVLNRHRNKEKTLLKEIEFIEKNLTAIT